MLLPLMRSDIISLSVQLTCLILAVQYAVYKPNLKSAGIVAVLLMFLANFWGQLVIAGEGPAAFCGIFLFPLYGLLAVWITVKIIKKRCPPPEIQPPAKTPDTN